MPRALLNLATAAIVLLSAILCASLGPREPEQSPPAVNQDSLIVRDFEKQVDEYAKVHKKAEAGVPRLKSTDSPQTINEHRRLLADNIRVARADAKQGSVFSPEISQLFKRLITTAYQSAGSARVSSSLRHDEPVNNVRRQVNAAYPESVPLQTTPPSLLLGLPQLPPVLDYRIVGRDLILRDVEANIIVDYIPAAIPHS